MFRVPRDLPQSASQPAQSPSAELLDRMGLTSNLPRRLAQDDQERPFIPIQLTLSKDLVPQLALLLRREPVGGAEPQIAENRARQETEALQQMHRFLAGGSGSPRSVVQELLHATQARKTALEQRHVQVEQDYTQVQELLHPWQERMGKRAGKTGTNLWRWLVGGAGHMSLPEAGTLWNRREELALRRATGYAALSIYDRILDTLTDLYQQLDEVLGQARRIQRVLHQQAEEVRQSSGVFTPWTLHIASDVVSAAVLEQIDIEGLVSDLLQHLGTAVDAAAFETHVRKLARQAAHSHLDGLTLADQIDLDARASGHDAADDPLVLVGQALLRAVQQPTWHLTRGARPRVETIQVTPDGTPLYDLEGLHSATYDGAHRLGFVQVHLGVAFDDLALLHESEDMFVTALQQRNLYVVDDLAAQCHSAPPVLSEQPASHGGERTNGHVNALQRGDEEGDLR